ncbi:MAG: tRNA lysidine(34) synthetase TilS [Bacteroidales bacterium]|nr:tRNA lysidine(34) synthetase TilS [Bacteroidales bacterium]
MNKEFISFIEKNKLIKPKDEILVAVSGGVDSMVMLNLFSSCGYKVAVAHCNFSLRGVDSNTDEQLVVDVCKRMGVKLFTKLFHTEVYAHEHNISIQVAARELRYGWFKELRDEHGYASVAIAHNKNDVAETMLINLTRGTGLKGLTGIRALAKGVIRPLLFAFRKQIEAYAFDNGVEYRNDKTNAEVKYARNRVRHNVITELEKINPGVVDNLYGTSLFLSETWRAIETMNAEHRGQICSEKGNEVYYSIKGLLEYPFHQLFLLEELVGYGFSPSDVQDIKESLLAQSGKTFYADSYLLIRDRDYLILGPNIQKNYNEVSIDSPSDVPELPIPLEFEVIDDIASFKIPKVASVGVFDADKVQFPLLLRPWHKGDWFVPFGMEGRKKVSDFLIDQKIPIHHKNSIYVLESDGNIVWVVGHRIDNRYRVNPESTKALYVKIVG